MQLSLFERQVSIQFFIVAYLYPYNPSHDKTNVFMFSPGGSNKIIMRGRPLPQHGRVHQMPWMLLVCHTCKMDSSTTLETLEKENEQ